MDVFSVRLPADLLLKLERAGEERGKSISWEIQYRLSRSFDEENDAAKEFGSLRTKRVMQVLALAASAISNPKYPKREWLEDPWAFQQAWLTIQNMLSLFFPHSKSDEISSEKLALKDRYADLAWLRAVLVLQSIRNADDKSPFGRDWRNLRIKAGLGSMLSHAAEHPEVTEDYLARAHQMLRALEERKWALARAIACDERGKGIHPHRMGWWRFAEEYIDFAEAYWERRRHKK